LASPLLAAGKIDPYVIVQYRSQECKSSVARGQLLLQISFFFLLNFPPFQSMLMNRERIADQGRNPCWNEVFKFQINSSASSAQHKLILRIMDHDHFSSDDFLGEAT